MDLCNQQEENETLTAAKLHRSTNMATKTPLCGLSPAPSIGANRHCLGFPPAVYFQNDYCMAHTICSRCHCEGNGACYYVAGSDLPGPLVTSEGKQRPRTDPCSNVGCCAVRRGGVRTEARKATMWWKFPLRGASHVAYIAR